MLLPGRHAARVRRQAAELLCRYLGGDLAVVDEVYRNRGFQEQLAVRAPDDPRRLFGEVVEATGGTVGSATTTQLARACTEAIAKAVPGIIERLSAHIDERMAQDRQRVNRNVRAPESRDRQARSGNRSPEIIRIAPLQATSGERSAERPPNVWTVRQICMLPKHSTAPSYGGTRTV